MATSFHPLTTLLCVMVSEAAGIGLKSPYFHGVLEKLVSNIPVMAELSARVELVPKQSYSDP